MKIYNIFLKSSALHFNKTERCNYIICVQYTKFWVEFWNPLIPGQIVNSFGQGKCTFDCQSGNFKNYFSDNHVSTRSCMLRIQKLINFNMTFHTNSLLHGYLFLMHVHKQRQLWTLSKMIWYSLQGQFSANEGTAYSIIIINTILLNCILNDIATCNFYFSVSDYVCTLRFIKKKKKKKKTISCQVCLSYMPTLPDTTTISSCMGQQISQWKFGFWGIFACISSLTKIISPLQS